MIKNILLLVSITILCAVSCTKLAQKYTWDITQNNVNTLTKSSMQLLDTLDDSMTITVYSPNMEILNGCEKILDPYKKYSRNVKIVLQQNILEPSEAAKLKLQTEYNLVINYKTVQEGIDLRLNEMSEQHFSSLLQQVINSANHWIAFLSGHQEGDPLSNDEFGLSGFAQLFAKQGMHVVTMNLAQQKFIPQNTSLLIVANPQQDFLPAEKAMLHQYISNGGKLIWFTEPDAPITAFIAEEFGLKPAKGVAIDPESLRLGSPHPALKIITKYPEHAITKDLTSATILPWSGHLQILYQANDWEQSVFLQTAAETWTYSGPATRDLNILNKYQEIAGPLNLGIALSRPNANGKDEQRALVLADSSFMINKYLSLYANTQLATNIVTWAHNDAHMFVFNTPPLRDLTYHPSKFDQFMYQYVFTLVIPVLLIAVGFILGRQNWLKLRFRFKI